MPARRSPNSAVENQWDNEEYLDRLGKVRIAHQAAVAQDLIGLLKMDREGQRKAESEIMGGKGDDDMGDINIDSPTYHQYMPKGDGTMWPMLLVFIAETLISFAISAMMRDKPAVPPASPPPTSAGPADSAYKILFFDKDGKQIHVPHLSEKPK